MDTIEAEKLLSQAIVRSDLDKAKLALASGHHFGDSRGPDSEPWLLRAATKGFVPIISAMLDAGFNINALSLPEKSTALSIAIGFDQDEVVELLLRRGADVSIGRPLIGALNPRKTAERRLRYVELLVEHGVDVNQRYDLFGDPNKQFTALDWTKDPAVIKYLRSHGAKTLEELRAEQGQAIGPSAEQKEPLSAADEVIRFFGDNFGTVDQRSLIEIVPTGHPIAIHVIIPEGNRKDLTLFTTGLSEKPMATPRGQEEFAFAELFIQLPGDWPYGSDCPPDKAWVIHWLRRIAQYPHDNNTWLGGPLTVIDNEDPPQPLGPGVRFTSWMLLAEKSFKRTDGKEVQLYRLTPLYRDERDLERQQGAPALLRAFDRSSVPFIVDMNRESVTNTHDS
jgi:hypothetical protein